MSLYVSAAGSLRESVCMQVVHRATNALAAAWAALTRAGHEAAPSVVGILAVCVSNQLS